MRTSRAVNSLIDDLFERKNRKVGLEKKRFRIFFSCRVFCFNIVSRERGLNIGSFTICWVLSPVWTLAKMVMSNLVRFVILLYLGPCGECFLTIGPPFFELQVYLIITPLPITRISI